MSDPYDGQSTNKDVPGVSGENTVDGGVGVRGQSKSAGVVGVGETWHGVTGLSSSTSGGAGVFGASDVGPGIIGESKVWHAVYGKSDSTVGGTGVTGEHTGNGAGTAGRSNTGPGVYGESTQSEGVRGVGHSPDHGAVVGINEGGGIGVFGESNTYEGVRGASHSRDHGGVVGTNDGGGNAVFGISTNGGDAVFGRSPVGGRGVAGFSEGGPGVYGHSVTQAGVVGESDRFDGVFGKTYFKDAAGVTGWNTAGGKAGFFFGDVTVTGTLTANVDVVLGADCAEEFDISEATDVEPGTVMVLNPEGALQPSQQAYDKRVAGVISGAGDYKPGIVLDKQQSSENRMPVALVGKVYCKVDAQYASIEVGDLLTTSLTPGHAMKAGDHLKAFGSVIGKALRPLEAGQGLIPILIALQ